MPNYYRSFNLIIESELELPELLKATGETRTDIVIRFGQVPQALENPTSCGLRYQTRYKELLLDVKGIARYNVRQGRDIVIAPYPGIDAESIRLFLLGSCFGAALQQRGRLVLHGSAVAGPKRCIAFLGPSGIGKSTLAQYFCKRGYKLVTDDLCVVRFPNHRPMVSAAYPHNKLWPDALKRLCIDPAPLPKIRPQIHKRLLAMKSMFSDQEHTLDALFIITKDPLNKKAIDGFGCTGDKYRALRNNSYRPQFIEGQGLKNQQFMSQTRLIGQIPIHILRHGYNLDQLAAVSDIIEKALENDR